MIDIKDDLNSMPKNDFKCCGNKKSWLYVLYHNNKYKWIFGFIFIITSISLISSAFWEFPSLDSFQDDFNRADGPSLGSDWNVEFAVGDGGVDASIRNNALFINDSSGTHVVKVVSISPLLNDSHSEIEMNFSYRGNPTTGPGFQIRVNNENNLPMMRFGIDNNRLLQATIPIYNITPDVFRVLRVAFNYTSGVMQVFINDTNIINISAQSNGTRFGAVEFFTGDTANIGNLTIDYVQWGKEEEFNLTQISPVNNFNTTDNLVKFICEANQGNNLTNVSLFIDGVLNQTQTNLSTTNNITLTRSVTLVDGVYNWYCDAFDSLVNRVLTNNRTLNITMGDLEINSIGFNATTSEGSLEPFSINITYNTTLITNSIVRLNYNNTFFTSSTSDTEDTRVYTVSLTIPKVSGSENKSFYWEINLINDTNNLFNSTVNSQIINNINIDDCSSFGVLLLNYSLKDEVTQQLINATLFNTSVEIDINIFSLDDLTTPIIEFSTNFSQNNTPQVCLQNDLSSSSFKMDVQTRYLADDYEAERHNIQKTSISNTSLPQNINLFDLKTADATEFLITFKDVNFLPVEDALVDIQRKYIEEGVFKSVEIPLTDENGQASAQFDLNSIQYTIIISKNGVILGVFNNIAVFCEDAVIGNCKIPLNAKSTITPIKDFETIGNITFVTTFDEDNKIINVIFTTTDGSSKTILLNTTRFDRLGNQTVCSDSLTSSSGTLTCTIPDSFGNITVVSRLFSEGNLISQRTFRITPDVFGEFSNNAGALVLIMMLTIPLMLITSNIGVILGVIIGLVMASLLMIFQTTSIFGVSSSILWLIITGGILIWKMARRGG